MKRKYKIFITDGYATSGHAPNGEHPIGLAADIIPRQHGGRWGKIDKLAKRFEPHQNQVRMPMRWVGYNGDANHGRGNHLHLSWSHSDNDHAPQAGSRRLHAQVPREVRRRLGGGDGGSGGGGGGELGGVNPRKSGGLTPAEKAQHRAGRPRVARARPATAARPNPKQMDRAARPRERSSGVPAVACSGQAYRGTCPLPLKAASFRI